MPSLVDKPISNMNNVFELFFGPNYQQPIISGALIGAIVRSINHKGNSIQKVSQFWIGFLTSLGVTPLFIMLIGKISDLDAASAPVTLGIGFFIGNFGVEAVLKLGKYVDLKSILLSILNGGKKQ